jgi:DNA replication and repair protein RecF
VWIETLRLANLRAFAQLELELNPKLNLFLGPNGSGKTTLLEAAYLLSHGRSFRRGGREALLRRGESAFHVFVSLHQGSDPATTRLGLERRGDGWTARRNEQSLSRLSELYQSCAVCCFEPGSHELIGGASEDRRALLDWGVFHVEPSFLESWRRYQRALRQRNALLVQGAPERDLQVWDLELSSSGARLTTQRLAYMADLNRRFQAVTARLVPELGAAALHFLTGWDGEDEESLRLSLSERLPVDRQRRATGRGPHRAHWLPWFEHAPQRTQLSRGQEKLTAVAVTLAQASLHAARAGDWPIVALDDLPSELDHAHQAQLLDELLRVDAQLLVTGTEASPPLLARLAEAAVFHVEHGVVRQEA